METVAGVREMSELDAPEIETSSVHSSLKDVTDSEADRLGGMVPSIDEEFMKVEDFLEDMHPDRDGEQNLQCTPSDDIPTGKIGNGRLAPTADDDLMEVEDFLKDMLPAGESEQNVVFTSNNDIPTNNTGVGNLVTTMNDVLEVAEDSFNDIHSAGDGEQIVVCTPGDEILTSQQVDPEVVVEKASVQQDAEGNLVKCNAQPEELVCSSATESNESGMNQFGSNGGYSNPVDEPIKSGPPGPTACASSKPDFSKLKGKICLNSLSVRELQETFRATFGRETSVKDKQWLKRRIAMGLSNSCDVLSMTFVIEEGNGVKIVQEGSSRAVVDALVEDLVVGEVKEKYEVLPTGCNNKTEDPENISGEILRNPSTGHDCISEDQQASVVASKRVRKPTRRYIELSEVESRENNGNLTSSSKKARHSHSILNSNSGVKPACEARSVPRPLGTRQDSLGGSGVWVPYACRVRRSRPRENYVAFMKLHPESMDMIAELVKEELSSCGHQLDDEIGNKIFTSGPGSELIQKPILDEPEKEIHCPESDTCEPEKDVEARQWDPSEDNSDNYAPTAEKAKSGFRRKHHRPWSLTEVVKLVEGVAKYGAGRWSEIKRLAFASHSYRTSVDLKDKWRNLLRASFAQPAADKVNSRKQVSAPIPPQVLLRVRELAKMQAQVPPILGSSKLNGGNVEETSPGYL